ncbi:MAG: bacillithiol biosynthesis cysteine-adding enzyme BshC [Acidobacteria bacterium]|nr:bacillithiol biosynthesis cysteine-adding enzyme BshC [Acidobacteriota bacterium]
MLPQTGLSATSTRLPVEIRRFPWIKRLAADYAFEYARLADFFAGNPADPSAWREAIARAQRHPRQRDTIADVVEAQQRRRGAPPEALAAAARLRDPQTIAIVTGQQAGLFGGPLFTLLKALTAIRLAERVAGEHRVPAVALFWIDAEDHDWDEVKACGVLDAELNFAEGTLGRRPGAGEGPVARVRLDASIAEAVGALASRLPATEFSPSVIEAVRAAYRPGNGMVDAFGQLLESILGPRGLIVFDAADPAAKPLAGPIFAREVEQAGTTPRLAAEAGAALVARGYHAQVTPALDHLALFRLDGVRAGIHVREAAALLERVRARPAEFSPNVLLRPIVQDALFPTACYVTGPNELAYLAQLRGIYGTFGVPMPLMYHRTTATIVDSNTMRFLARHDLPLEALRAQDEGALNQLLAAQIPPAVNASHEEAARAVAERMEALARAAAQLDPTLEGAVRSTLGRMQDDLKKLHAKIIQAVKRKDETLRRQFRHAQAQAFPGGDPQERAIGFVYFLNKHGSALIDRLGDDLPLDQGTHWVVTI